VVKYRHSAPVSQSECRAAPWGGQVGASPVPYGAGQAPALRRILGRYPFRACLDMSLAQQAAEPLLPHFDATARRSNAGSNDKVPSNYSHST
jgi:hypothetical protein